MCVFMFMFAFCMCVCVCVCVCVHGGMNEKFTRLTDFQLLLCDQSHGLHQPFPRAGDGLHSQAKVRLG